MSNTTAKTPDYCRHKPTGRAYVRLNGRMVYLGEYGSPASRAEYDRIVAEWLVAGRKLATAPSADLTVTELLAGYWTWAEGYYVKNGHPSSEQHNIRSALAPLRRLYGHAPVSTFGPTALKALREVLIQDALCRKTVNGRIEIIRRAFKWGVENELVPPSVLHGLQAVAGLKRGRSEARETAPVKPVPDAFVDAIKPHVSRPVWAMIELQRLTGMRSGEVAILRACDVDMSGSLWIYRPACHKTEHHDRERVVTLGPQAQAIVRSFLKPETHAYLFSPIDAERERRADMHARRKTPLSYGNRPGTNRKRRPEWTPGEHYTTASYMRAVTRGCELADRAAKAQALAEGRQVQPGERIIPHWHPHQLRHNYATNIRRQYGIEAARVMLGHATTTMTEIYAERDSGVAAEVAAKYG